MTANCVRHFSTRPGSRPAFVVFEGLDGSGKSTCARRTAELLGAHLMTTPSPALRELRERILAGLAGSQEPAQLFYLSTVFAASQEIKGLLDQGRPVVLDRYFLSTQAYAEFRGSRLELDALAALLVPADLTVYLDAPLALRQSRIAARGASAADHETLTPEADARLKELHFQRERLPVVGEFLRLDSSQASPDVLARRVAEVLRSRATQP